MRPQPLTICNLLSENALLHLSDRFSKKRVLFSKTENPVWKIRFEFSVLSV